MELAYLTIVVLLIVIVVQWSRFRSALMQKQKEITDLESKYHRAVIELTNKMIGIMLGK